MFREPNGKPSFSRIFGAVFLTSVVVGWWLEGFSLGFVMPHMTEMLLAIAVAPYGINKLAGAWASRNGRAQDARL